MTFKPLDSILNLTEPDGFSFSLHPHASAASATFAETVAALKDRVVDLVTVLNRNGTSHVAKLQIGKCLVSAADRAAAFDVAAPSSWDLAQSVRSAYMAARSNDSKAHHIDCDYLVGLFVVVPAIVPPALAPFAVDHQRLAMLFEIALSDLLQQAAPALAAPHQAPAIVLAPNASWDEAHKSANATLVHVLLKLAANKPAPAS